MRTRESMLERWSIVVVAVIVVIPLGGVLGLMLSGFFGSWPLPFGTAGAAFAAVGMAYYASPRSKVRSATICLLAGFPMAWVLLAGTPYPEPYRELAYQPSLLPFASACLGGISALITAVVHSVWVAGR